MIPLPPSVLLVAVLLVAAPRPGPGRPAPGSAPARPDSCQATPGQRTMDLVNAERLRAGLPPLTADTVLARAARIHAEDMAAGMFVSHRGRDGSDPSQRLDGVGYPTPSSLWEGSLPSRPRWLTNMPAAMSSAWMRAARASTVSAVRGGRPARSRSAFTRSMVRCPGVAWHESGRAGADPGAGRPGPGRGAATSSTATSRTEGGSGIIFAVCGPRGRRQRARRRRDR